MELFIPFLHSHDLVHYMQAYTNKLASACITNIFNSVYNIEVLMQEDWMIGLDRDIFLRDYEICRKTPELNNGTAMHVICNIIRDCASAITNGKIYLNIILSLASHYDDVVSMQLMAKLACHNCMNITFINAIIRYEAKKCNTYLYNKYYADTCYKSDYTWHAFDAAPFSEQLEIAKDLFHQLNHSNVNIVENAFYLAVSYAALTYNFDIVDMCFSHVNTLYKSGVINPDQWKIIKNMVIAKASVNNKLVEYIINKFAT